MLTSETIEVLLAMENLVAVLDPETDCSVGIWICGCPEEWGSDRLGKGTMLWWPGTRVFNDTCCDE